MLKNIIQNKSRLKPLGLAIVAVSLSILLSSCHIDQKPAETIARTTDTLRIYQPGDFIEYNVTAVFSADGAFITTQGSMRVQWESTAPLIDPIDQSSHPVLKETTTFTYDDEISPDATVIRYITQVDTTPPSPNQGSILLHAISDGNDLYWLYDNDAGASPDNSNTPVISPIVFDSPITVGVAPLSSPINFSVMEGCDPGLSLCGTRVFDFNDSYTVEGDTKEIPTNLGTFINPFELSFTGGTIPKTDLALSVLGDFRNTCGDSTSETISHNGNIFVVPEIGIVQITNLCRIISGSSGDVNYTITVNNTNIPLPQ